MTQDKKSIKIIIGMFILLVIIIIPPVLRTLIPKSNTIVTIEKEDVITTLTCTKGFKTENIVATATITYKNNELLSNKITYNKVNTIDQEDNINSILPSQEIEFFKGVNGIKIEENDESTTVTLDNNLLANNQSNSTLNNYLLKVNEEKTYYENQGYTCKKEAN